MMKYLNNLLLLFLNSFPILIRAGFLFHFHHHLFLYLNNLKYQFFVFLLVILLLVLHDHFYLKKCDRYHYVHRYQKKKTMASRVMGKKLR